MAIVLHHIIVRTRDTQRSAAFLADLLGLEVGDRTGPFVPVRINDDLVFDFDDRFALEHDLGHYAFQVDDLTFDAALERIGGADVEFGSGPGRWMDREINRLGGGRGVYVRDPHGHSYELFTAVPTFSTEGLLLNGHSANGHGSTQTSESSEAAADPVDA